MLYLRKSWKNSVIVVNNSAFLLTECNSPIRIGWDRLLVTGMDISVCWYLLTPYIYVDEYHLWTIVSGTRICERRRPLIFGLQGKQQDCTFANLNSCSCFHHLLKLKGSVHIAKQYTAKSERATDSTWNHIHINWNESRDLKPLVVLFTLWRRLDSSFLLGDIFDFAYCSVLMSYITGSGYRLLAVLLLAITHFGAFWLCAMGHNEW
jgi:hypothetical protein